MYEVWTVVLNRDGSVNIETFDSSFYTLRGAIKCADEINGEVRKYDSADRDKGYDIIYKYNEGR